MHNSDHYDVDRISVACTIEPFEFPMYIKVRGVCNKLLQLRLHLQCQACILKPPHQTLLGSLPTRRNSLPLCLGYIAISVIVPALHPSPSDAPVDILSGTMPATASFQATLNLAWPGDIAFAHKSPGSQFKALFMSKTANYMAPENDA